MRENCCAFCIFLIFFAKNPISRFLRKKRGFSCNFFCHFFLFSPNFSPFYRISTCGSHYLHSLRPEWAAVKLYDANRCLPLPAFFGGPTVEMLGFLHAIREQSVVNNPSFLASLPSGALINDPAAEDERFTEACFVEKLSQRRQSWLKLNSYDPCLLIK